PLDVNCHATLPRGSCNGGDNITPGRAALRDFDPAHVSCGSFMSFPPSRPVRFAPRADIRPKPAFMSTHTIAHTARSETFQFVLSMTLARVSRRLAAAP